MILLGSQEIQTASLVSVELLQYAENCSYLNETVVSRIYLYQLTSWGLSSSKDLPGSGGVGDNLGTNITISEKPWEKNQKREIRNYKYLQLKSHHELSVTLGNASPAAPE